MLRAESEAAVEAWTRALVAAGAYAEFEVGAGSTNKVCVAIPRMSSPSYASPSHE